MSNVKFRLVLGVIAASIAVGVLAVAAAGSSTKPEASKQVSVGVDLPLSGAVSQIGLDLRQGIQLGATVASRTFLKGWTFKFDFQDNAFDKQRSVVNFQRFTSNKDAAIIGPLGSLIAPAALPIAQQAKIPALSPSAPDSGLTNIGNYVFATLPAIATTVPPALLKALDSKKISYRRPAILISSQYDVGTVEVANLKKLLAAKNIKPVLEGQFGASDTDFSAQVALVKNANPDVIFLTGALPAAALVAKQLRAAGVTTRIIGDVSVTLASFANPAGSAAEGVVGIVNYYANDVGQAKSTRAFTANYRARYQADPSNYAAIGYDSVMSLAWAIKQGNSADSTKIRNALANLKPFAGATGQKITYTKQRTLVGDGVAVVWKGGKLVAFSAVK